MYIPLHPCFCSCVFQVDITFVQTSEPFHACASLCVYMCKYGCLFSCEMCVDLCIHIILALAAAAKSLQSCPTLCDPIDGNPPGSPVPGILQARTLEWVAISFSKARKWKVKVKSLSRVRLLVIPWTEACQAPPSMGFSKQKSTGVGCHCLLVNLLIASFGMVCHLGASLILRLVY